jgi:hypothetical protein
MTAFRSPYEKNFAFTVFEDPGGWGKDARLFVYPLLHDLGFRTTKAVWPSAPVHERNCLGETCSDKEYPATIQHASMYRFGSLRQRAPTGGASSKQSVKQIKTSSTRGLCINVYTFRQSFVHDQKLDARFCKLMRRLSGKNGWFALVSTIRDYIGEQRGDRVITPAEPSALEWKWFGQKLFRGTS